MNFYKGKFEYYLNTSLTRNETEREICDLIDDLNKKCINTVQNHNIAFSFRGVLSNPTKSNQSFDEIMHEIVEENSNKKIGVWYYVKSNKKINDFTLFKKNVEKIFLSGKEDMQLAGKSSIGKHTLFEKNAVDIYDEVISKCMNVMQYLYNGIMDEKDIPFINNCNINCSLKKYNIEAKKLEKAELVKKHVSVLKNYAFNEEVDRAYKIVDKNNIQGVNYLFNENNSVLRKKQYEAIADTLYATGRLDEPAYCIARIDVWGNDLKSFLTYLKNRIKITNNSLYFFEFDKISSLNNDPFSNNTFSAVECISNFCDNLKKNQYFTTFGFSISDEVRFDFECLSEKSLTENFSLVVFNNKMNVEAQKEYAKMRLENINHMDLLQAMYDIINTNSDENDGHTTLELDDYINSLLKDKYDRIYKKAYKDITMEMKNGNITEKLMNMVGLHNLKKAVAELKSRARFKDLKENLLPVTKALSKFANVERNNWILTGDPGTGKSRAAEILEKVMYQEKIITKDLIVKYTPSYQSNEEEDTFPNLFGTTNVSTIKDSFVQAVGGVLIVDEIGHLSAQDKSLLLQLMEDNKKSVSVILCGYEKEAQEFLNYNPGFRSRFTHIIHMENYTLDELFEILEKNLGEKHFYIKDDAKSSAKALISDARAVSNFGQARFIESLTEKLISIHSSRKLNAIEDMLDKQEEKEIRTDDIYEISKEDIEKVPVAEMLGEEYDRVKRFGDPYEELKKLIGCKNIKTAIGEYIAKAQVDLLKFKKKLIKKTELNMNMVFYGAPGTAKTTVARLVARILYDKGIVNSPEIVEAGASDLVAGFVGQTALKTAALFEKARNKVLFIDEAYALANKEAGGYNQEAIDTIIREMENHRSDTMVIFAGYKKPMQDFINCNPGFKSRISKYIDFENYSMKELQEIFMKLTSDAGYVISANSKKQILDKIEKYLALHIDDENFGNGRECRTILENAINKQSQRIVALEENEQEQKLMTLELEDFSFDTNDFTKDKVKSIGFVA